jgi:hypothetical protein
MRAGDAVAHGRLLYRAMVRVPDGGEEMPVGRIRRPPIRRFVSDHGVNSLQINELIS